MCLITLRLMLPYTFLHVPGILETLQKMRCANITFQRINSGKKARKNLEDVFLSRFSFIITLKMGCCISHYFCIFHEPTSGLLFLDRPSLCGITLSHTFLQVPGILEHVRCANIPLRETIVARKLERIKMYFIEVLLH